MHWRVHGGLHTLVQKLSFFLLLSARLFPGFPHLPHNFLAPKNSSLCTTLTQKPSIDPFYRWYKRCLWSTQQRRSENESWFSWYLVTGNMNEIVATALCMTFTQGWCWLEVEHTYNICFNSLHFVALSVTIFSWVLIWHIRVYAQSLVGDDFLLSTCILFNFMTKLFVMKLQLPLLLWEQEELHFQPIIMG